MPDDGILRDVDSPDDLAALLADAGQPLSDRDR
jgi:hypothetical protein